MWIKMLSPLFIRPFFAIAFIAIVSTTNLSADTRPYTLKLHSVDVNEVAVPDSEFSLQVLLVHEGDQITVQFPLFNFQTDSTGYTLRSLNKLPHRFRPKSNEKFTCSNNDAYLQPINFIEPFPTPVNSFNLSVKKSGKIRIGQTSSITPGGHTFNSQAVSYCCKQIQIESKKDEFSHTFTLQNLDYQNFALPNPAPFVDSLIETQGNLIKIHLPSISIQTTNTKSPLNKDSSPLILGGYINTMDGFLPEKLRPAQIQTVYDPISGLNLSIDTYGSLNIASPNDVTGVIPTGTYITSPTIISYHLPRNRKVKIDNFIIQPAFTNFTGFTSRAALDDGIRDSHVNDHYKGTLAWTWTDNSAQTDKTNNTMDAYVAIGKVRRGRVVSGEPIMLSQLPANVGTWDTAVAINRVNPKNIVVSFGQFDYSDSPSALPPTLNVCVSNDGGKTWSSPMNIDPSLENFGDARGVIADKYGNFWFSTTSVKGRSNINLLFYVSSDGGNTWNKVFETDDSNSSTGTYDYPQITVGNDGQGNYGLWFIGAFFDTNSNLFSRLGFIPTTGLGQFGTGSYLILDQSVNEVGLTTIVANEKGKVFINNGLGEYDFGNNYYANTLVTKLPGPLDQNLVLDPKTILNTGQNILPTTSYPYYSQTYFPATVNNSIYDTKRKALYVLYSEQPDPTNQNIYLYMVASFDEGKSWSKRIAIASKHLNNRGFSSIAFDHKAGTMSIGWYDSRNSPDSTSEQYFGAYLSKCKLNRIVRYLKKNNF